MVILGEDGRLPIVRQPLNGAWQAIYKDGKLYIDSSVPEAWTDEIINQVQHKLIGNDHLAPNCHPYERPRHLQLAYSAAADEDDGEGEGELGDGTAG